MTYVVGLARGRDGRLGHGRAGTRDFHQLSTEHLDRSSFRRDDIVRRELHAPTADLDEKTYQNFALTDDAVIFFFGQDQVVMDNAGPHKVTVPRAELASLRA